MYSFLLALSIISFSFSTFSYRAAIFSFLFLAAALALRPFISVGGSRIFFKFLIFSLLVVGVSAVNQFYMPYLIKYVGMLAFTIIFISMLNDQRPEILYGVGRYFLQFHIFLFTLQLFLYVFTGAVIDFNELIREDNARLIVRSRAVEDSFIGIRTSGGFSEPSIFSYTVLAVAPFMAMYKQKITILFALSVLAAVFSFSVASIFVSFLMVIFMLYIDGRKRTVFLIASVLLAISPLMVSLIIFRVVDGVDYDAVGYRLFLLAEFEERGFLRNLFGSGFFWNEVNPIGVTGLSGAQTRDSSAYLNVFFALGGVGLVYFLYMLFDVANRNKGYFLILLIFILFKVYILTAAFWIAIIYAYLFSKSTKRVEARL